MHVVALRVTFKVTVRSPPLLRWVSGAARIRLVLPKTAGHTRSCRYE